MLADNHLRMLLHDSAISEAVIQARGYRTITVAADLERYGFSRAQRRAPGLLLPLHPTDGGAPPLHVYRPDRPRTYQDRRQGGTLRTLKYEVPKGQPTRIDCPPLCQPRLGDPAVTLWITEGQKKADALASRDLCAIALLGVWNWKGRNALNGVAFANDWDYIALDGREVHIVYDSDVMTKTAVRQALARLIQHLERKGALVDAVYLPNEGGHKLGVDDYFAQGHTVDELRGRIEQPRPLPQPAQARIEILAKAPPILARPLALVEGRAYAATWLWVKQTIRETRDRRTGEIVRPRSAAGGDGAGALLSSRATAWSMAPAASTRWTSWPCRCTCPRSRGPARPGAIPPSHVMSTATTPTRSPSLGASSTWWMRSSISPARWRSSAPWPR